jgi:hypothetical protein
MKCHKPPGFSGEFTFDLTMPAEPGQFKEFPALARDWRVLQAIITNNVRQKFFNSQTGA